MTWRDWLNVAKQDPWLTVRVVGYLLAALVVYAVLLTIIWRWGRRRQDRRRGFPVEPKGRGR